MLLELATYAVSDVVPGSGTSWRSGTLQIDRGELQSLVAEDPYIDEVDIEIARPAESVRITNVRDVVEPKVKVGGSAVVYPGVAGRSVETVGRGRTNRLGGCTVMACAQMPEVEAEGSRRWLQSARHSFIDMSGPGAIGPYASLFNICIEIGTDRQPDADTWNRAIQGALLKVSDRLAEATIEMKPSDVEEFDFTPVRDLPKVVFIPVLASAEFRLGNTSSVGTAIYGVTRLTPPWLLRPGEMLDGAAFGNYTSHYTWPMTNTLALHMARRHGKDINFLGCVVVRSNWESQAEKQLMANRAVEIALAIGADGAIVTTNLRGARFVEAALTVQACERAGVQTVLLTEEEDSEDGNATPLLIPIPEAVAAVSTGTGGAAEPFPPVERVIGANGDRSFYGEQPPVHGRYGVSHATDVYGFTLQSCIDY